MIIEPLDKKYIYIIFYSTNNKFDLLAHIVRLGHKLVKKQAYTKFHHTGLIFTANKISLIRECRLLKNLSISYYLDRLVEYDGDIEIYEIPDILNNGNKILVDFNNNKVKYSILSALCSILSDNKITRLLVNKNKSFCSKDTAYCLQLLNGKKQHPLIALINQYGIDKITPQILYNYCKENGNLVWQR